MRKLYLISLSLQVLGESFSRSFKEMVRMCLQKEARKRPTVHTLLNCKFFKTKWPVTPLVEGLLNLVGNISALPSYLLKARFNVHYVGY